MSVEKTSANIDENYFSNLLHKDLHSSSFIFTLLTGIDDSVEEIDEVCEGVLVHGINIGKVLDYKVK